MNGDYMWIYVHKRCNTCLKTEYPICHFKININTGFSLAHALNRV